MVGFDQPEKLKHQAHDSIDESVRIFQIFYDSVQQEHLDSAFIPYDNRENPRPDLCEYYVFRKEYFSGCCNNGFVGFVSWKFFEKTGLTGSEFQRWIIENPGYDVYFINPYPMQRCKLNVWRHGNRCHPGISDLAQNLLLKCGYNIDLLSLSMAEEDVAFCNYWVGSASFWKKYIDFCDPIYEVIDSKLSESEVSALMRSADKNSGLCYIPYILERLFSTLLTVDSSIHSLSMEQGHSKKLTWADWFQREFARTCRRLAS